MAIKLSSLSTEYIRIPVSADVNGQPYNPTGSTVEFSFENFTADTKPDPGDWQTGDWDTDPGPPAIYYARILVGPVGTVTLSIGKYDVWVRIIDAPERPVRHVGTMTIA